MASRAPGTMHSAGRRQPPPRRAGPSPDEIERIVQRSRPAGRGHASRGDGAARASRTSRRRGDAGAGTITVLIVDDHDLLVETLSARLASEADIDVVGVAASAEQGVALARELQPDVVTLDIDMPGPSAFEAARDILRWVDGCQIMFLSGFWKDYYIDEALRAGAAAYVIKQTPFSTVLEAIRTVAAGESYYSPEILARIQVGRDAVSLCTPVQRLTPREREILRYIGEGMGTKEIARMLHLAKNTIEVHITHIRDKLDIHDRVELARFAIREGIAEL